jgi:formylglycine-generating enzyme required for sulfatase activity
MNCFVGIIQAKELSGEMLMEMAEKSFERKSFADAEGLWRQYLKLKPDDPEGLCEISGTLIMLGRDSEAREFFRKALHFGPQSRRDYFFSKYSFFLRLAGRSREALEAFKNGMWLSSLCPEKDKETILKIIEIDFVFAKIKENLRLDLYDCFLLASFGLGAGLNCTVEYLERNMLEPELGEVMVNSIGMKFRLIFPGSFLMGSDSNRENEKPVHKVRISTAFLIGVHEVTQKQFEMIMGTNPSDFKHPDQPVGNVTWFAAREFCRKLSEHEMGKASYRLPTEAEWEYACRAGTTTDRYWGNHPSEKYACLGDEWFGQPEPAVVGSFRPNRWGLFDMQGNVREWCEDRYGEYSCFDQTNPVGPSRGRNRISRGGGSWRSSNHYGGNSSYRAGGNPSYGSSDEGFRVIMQLARPK